MNPVIIFKIFSILFQPLYFLMILMFIDHFKSADTILMKILDLSILILGILFMLIQMYMFFNISKFNNIESFKKIYLFGLFVWFFLEVVLSYYWCYVTGSDPILTHTPFVILFLGFNILQYMSLKKLKYFN